MRFRGVCQPRRRDIDHIYCYFPYRSQKYITSLFIALSEDAKINSNKDLKVLVKNSQTPKGLNEQAVKELRKLGFYKSLNKTANSVLNRLKKSK